MDPRQKAQALKDWFEGRELPGGRHEIRPGTWVIDSKGFVEAQIKFMDSAKDMSIQFKNCFNRLWYFKIYLEENKL